MDLERYYELRAILQQWRMRLAESIRQHIEATRHWLDRLRAIYDSEGVGEEFTLWLDRWCRQAAIQFILRVLFLRVLEDRDLLGVTRIRDTDGQKMWAQLTRNLGAASYVQWCCWDAAHLLPDLFGPTDYDLVPPDDDLVQRFLDDVWRRPDPNRPGWLRFDFRPDPERGDEGFETRFIGDLYQELDAEIRKRYALLQTPHFISQFILEHTLLKRFEEKDFREVTLIDPTCGSGHFLVDAFWMFVYRYEQAGGRSREQLSSEERAQIARIIIEQHLFGCDINPYATALARFRLALAACDYAQPTSLRDFRDLHFNLVTIDSLIPYEKLMAGSWQADGVLAQILGQPEAIDRALPVLRRRYDVVVGNPPYIVPRDAPKRKLYREYYPLSAKGKYGLSSPFVERLIALAADNASIGLIGSNAFALRDYGRNLIEKVLPQYDIEMLIDSSGAYIPGHGTPTLILFMRKRSPKAQEVKVVAGLSGEPEIPRDPSDGCVWRSILEGTVAGVGYDDEYVEVLSVSRSVFAKHPWQFGGPANRLFKRMLKSHQWLLGEQTVYLGPGTATNFDDAYSTTVDFARRLGVDPAHVKPYIHAVDIRDWTATVSDFVFFPYTFDQGQLAVSELSEDPALLKYFQRFRSSLESRSALPASYKWYEYTRTRGATYLQSYIPCYAEVTTTNHLVIIDQPCILQRSARIVELKNPTKLNNLALAGILGSSTVCFLWKRRCFNKKPGDDPHRDNYEFTPNCTYSTRLPMDLEQNIDSKHRIIELVRAQMHLGDRHVSLTATKLFEKTDKAYHAWNSSIDGYVPPDDDLPLPFTSARELRIARDKLVALRRDIRGRMIFLQEEMDWLAYEMYGLLKSRAPLAEAYLSRADYEAARLELGQRPFEIAGKGYKGDWPKGYESAPLPESLRPLTEARIAVIEANSDIALLEDPLYKRRWIPPDYDKEFREAAERWLAEKLEWALEQHGRPISLREWTRSLGRDERVNAALEVLTGTPMFDLEEELLKIIRANAVPDRPEHYLKPSGLRKLYATRNTPQFSRKDFSDGTAWKQRRKLNIPRERFIAYTEFDHTLRGAEAPDTGGPWFGWAGWDAGQRADALAFLLDKANRAGWELRWRQCGLRAALRDLLPELTELPAADRLEFEGIAGMCGIGLGTSCYCQAYRDGIARGDPGVPGVDAQVLGVKALPTEGKRPRRGRKKAGGEAEQMRLDLEA